VKRQIQRLQAPSLQCVDLVYDELQRIVAQIDIKVDEDERAACVLVHVGDAIRTRATGAQSIRGVARTSGRRRRTAAALARRAN
jgi:hypothetical protein